MMKITKSIIEKRLETLNSMQGTKYIADYNPYYGGWSMHYVCNEYGGVASGDFGFDDRKSTREFFNYLVGIIAGLWYAERNKDKNKNELEIMEEIRTIASAWDLTINYDKSGIIYLTGFDDEEEAEYIINAEKLNGNTLARYNGGITLVNYQ